MTRITILLLSIAFFECNSKGQTNNESKIESLINLATLTDSLQDYRGSINYYTQILELDSTKPIALINRGRALVWVGQIDSGYADYNKAVRLYPRERTYYVRGMAEVTSKQFDRALSDFLKCLELKPTFGDAFYGLSFIKEHENDFDSAIYFCDKAEKLSYSIETLQRRKAELYEKNGNYSSAVNEWTKLIKTDTTNSAYYNNRGFNKNNLHQYKQALIDFESALKLQPKMAFALNNKAHALLKLKQFDQALEAVNTSLSINAQNAFALKNRGEIYLALSMREQACTDFRNTEKFATDSNLLKELKRLKELNCKD